MKGKMRRLIRDKQPQDRGQVRIVNEAALERSNEADLIDRLRVEDAVLASFVAEVDAQIEVDRSAG